MIPLEKGNFPDLMELRMVFSAKAYRFLAFVLYLRSIVAHPHRVYMVQFGFSAADNALLMYKALIDVIAYVVDVL